MTCLQIFRPTMCPHHNQLPIFQLEPVGDKTFRQDFEVGIELKCPSEVISSCSLRDIDLV